MLHAGDHLELAIEKPAAGGRMIARHEGQILLVSGAIPGERAAIVIERVDKRLAFAAVTAVLEPSPDRRPAPGDPQCGGCLYAHIDIARQRTIKAEVVADAFTRIGKHPLGDPVAVAPSPEHGYRMRARLHVKDGRVGFYREGTHDLCDAAATGQLHASSLAAIERVVSRLHESNVTASSVEIVENLAADQRALHVEAAGRSHVSRPDLEALLGPDVTSLGVATQEGVLTRAGAEWIWDPLDGLTDGRASGYLRRSPGSFFQGNRYLLPQLVTAVMDSVLPDGDVLDLYAGVGLFSVALAAAGRSGITAVEGQATGGADLLANALPVASSLTPIVAAVESHLARSRTLPPTVIVDPPRTGLSKDVVGALITRGARRIVYVSCDPPTMARDARSLIDRGYDVQSIRAYDLFPNTPHVEVLAVFDRRPA